MEQPDTGQNQRTGQNNTSQTTKLDELESSGFIVIPIKGVSMRPLLYTYKSHVLIRKLEGRPKRTMKSNPQNGASFFGGAMK